MTNTELLVRAILSHATNYEWSLQGLGMFRLYLSKEVRLHVWDDRFKVANVSTLHTHPWHFESTIVSGEIRDRVCSKRPWAHPGDTLPYYEQKLVCGPGGCLVGKPSEVLLYSHPVAVYRAGTGYSLASHQIHDTDAKRGTVTIVRREFLDDTEHAFVYYGVGTQWVSAEPRPATTAEVEAMSVEALRVLDAR